MGTWKDTQLIIIIVCVHACAHSVAQSCLDSLHPMDCSLPGSSVHGSFHSRYWSGLPFPTSGDLPNPGIEPVSLASLALGGGFFTTEPPGKQQVTIDPINTNAYKTN